MLDGRQDLALFLDERERAVENQPLRHGHILPRLVDVGSDRYRIAQEEVVDERLEKLDDVSACLDTSDERLVVVDHRFVGSIEQ